MSEEQDTNAETDVDLDEHSSIEDGPAPHQIKESDIVYREIRSNKATKKHRFTAVMRNMFTRQFWSNMKPLTADFLIHQKMPAWYIFNAILVDMYNAESLVITELKDFFNQFIFIVDSNRYNFVLELMMFTLVKSETILLDLKPHIKELRKRVERSRDSVIRRTNEPLSPSYDLLERIYNVYEQYIEFVDWNLLVEQYTRESQRTIARGYSQSTFNHDLSERLSSSIIEKLLTILEGENPPEMNLDIIPLILIRIYEYRNDIHSAKDMFERYAQNYPNHLNANLYLYEFIKNHPEVMSFEEFKTKRTLVLRNIVRLCPDSRYSLRFASLSSQESGISSAERIHILVNFIDYVKNRRSKKAWNLLTKVMNEFTYDSQEEYDTLKVFFEYRLMYWKRLHFLMHEIIHFAENISRIKQTTRLESDSETAFSSASFVNRNSDDYFTRIVISNATTNFTKDDYLLMTYKVKFLDAYRKHFGVMDFNYEEFLRIAHSQ